MRATIKDVARVAGVSTKTVSRVLRNARYVGAETRGKVEAAVAELDFRVSAAPRAAGGALRVVLVCDDAAPWPALAIQAGVRARCEAEGLAVVTMACDRASPPIGELLALVETLRVDGVILGPMVADRADVRAALAARGIRTVPVSAEGAAVPSVGIDDARAAAVMTRHLLALGHRRIGFVGDDGDASGRRRAEGHRAALAAAGIVAEAALFVEAVGGFAAGARAAAVLLALAEPPSAIFASNDAAAAGVMTAAHARGLRLPEDLSVVGFGDAPLAGYVWPPLTTIHAPMHDLGWQAADLLLTGVDARRELAFDLVERASTIGVGV